MKRTFTVKDARAEAKRLRHLADGKRRFHRTSDPLLEDVSSAMLRTIADRLDWHATQQGRARVSR